MCVKYQSSYITGGPRGRDHMVVGFTTNVQLVSITTNVASSNPAQTWCIRYIML